MGLPLVFRRNPLAFPAGRSPGFDASHPASNGLLRKRGFSAVPIGANFVNVIDGSPFTASNTTAAIRAAGPCVKFSSATSACTQTGYSASTTLTLAAVVEFSSLGSVYQGIVGSSTNASTNSPILYLQGASGGPLDLYSSGDQSSTIKATSTNTPFFIAVSAKSSTKYNYILVNLTNGSIVTNSITPSAGFLTANGTVVIGNGNTTSQPALGYIYASMYSYAFLSIPQLLAWAQDPWSFWYPRTRDNLIFSSLTRSTPPATYSLSAASGAFALTGNAATLKVARNLSAANGAFVLAGSAATIKRALGLGASSASFALSGHAASFGTAYGASLSQGAFALSGHAAQLAITRVLSLAAGSFALVGSSATERVARGLVASSGSFALSGDSASMAIGHALAGATGSFALGGSAAAIKVSRGLTAATGSFGLTGSPAAMEAGAELSVLPGSFSLSGHTATFDIARGFGVGVGAFALSGQAATLKVYRFFPAIQGAFAFTGDSAGLGLSRGLSASSGVFAFTGSSANIKVARGFSLQPGAFVLSGSGVSVARGYGLLAGAGSFSLTGETAAFALGHFVALRRTLKLNARRDAIGIEGRLASGVSLIGAMLPVSLTAAKPNPTLTGSKPNTTLEGDLGD